MSYKVEEDPVKFRPRNSSIRSSRDRSSLETYNYNRKILSTDLADLKALYDRHIISVTRNRDIIPILPKSTNLRFKSLPSSSVDVGISGRYSKNHSRQESRHNLKVSQNNLPTHIFKEAMTLGLNQKPDAFVSADSLLLESDTNLPGIDSDEDENVDHTFRGNITLLENPHNEATALASIKKLQVHSSTRVIPSEIKEQFLLEDIWFWPWIDFTQNHLHLYKDISKHFASAISDLTCPIPNPEHAFKRYLETTEPFLSFSQFENTKKIVEKFILHHNERLQSKVANSNSKEESWIQKLLPNHDYCLSKQGSPLINRGIIAPFCHDVWPEKQGSMLERGIILVRLATEFWDLIRTETLKPVQDDRGNMIDMQQFFYLFSSTTIPGIPKTLKCQLMKTQSTGPTARHIVVIYSGTMFVMNVADEKYRPLVLADIGRSLQALINYVDSGDMVERDGVSVLTASSDIASWSEERQRLSKMESNEEMFSEVDHALFVLSLEHMSVNSLDQVANEAMFADGCNRWYDKSLNFYIHNNGFVTLNINSKLLDCSTVAFLLHYIHLRILDESQSWEDEIIAKNPRNRSNSLMRISIEQLVNTDNRESATQKHSDITESDLKTNNLKLINFSIDNTSREKISKSAYVFEILSSGTLTSVCKIDDLDKSSSLDGSINKDAFAHMALHLTFYRQHYRPASIGSRVSIRKFANVRYDTLRSTTKEMVKWCKIFLDKDADKEEKCKLFWKAHDKHVLLLKECLRGEGYDNYLNSLRNLTPQAKIPPENNIFEDEGFFLSGGGDRYEILAETLGVGCTSCPVLLPCNPRGYGVGYCVANCFLFFTVTSWEEEISSCAPLFATGLKQICREMLDYISLITSQ